MIGSNSCRQGLRKSFNFARIELKYRRSVPFKHYAKKRNLIFIGGHLNKSPIRVLYSTRSGSLKSGLYDIIFYTKSVESAVCLIFLHYLSHIVRTVFSCLFWRYQPHLCCVAMRNKCKYKKIHENYKHIRYGCKKLINMSSLRLIWRV